VSAGRYALGVGALVCVVGSLGLAALTLRRFLLPRWSGARARLAECVLGLALLEWLSQGLGTVGLLRFGPIVVGSLAIGVGIRWWVRPSGDASPETAARVGLSGALQLTIAVLGAAAVMAEWAAPTLQSYDRGILGFDSIWYHLPWAASFAQTGQITGFRFTDVEYLNAFYPATAELFHGVGIVLMGNDVLSPVINLVWLGLVLLAAWCIGQPRGVGPAALLGAALAMSVPTVFFSQPGTADNDIAGVFFALAAVALLLNWDRSAIGLSGAPGSGGSVEPLLARARKLAPLALAGIAAGMAIAVKLNLLGPFLALSAGVTLLAPSGRRLAVGGVWLAAAFAAGGYWYVRNLFAVGNPLPWLGFGVLPTPDPPLQQHTSYSVAHYLRDPTVLTKVFGPGLADAFGGWWVVILLVGLFGALLCVTSHSDRIVQIIGLVVLASVAAYVVTPGTAAGPLGHPHGFQFNVRYCAPALTLAFAGAPLATPLRGPRMRWLTLAVLFGLLVASLSADRLWTAGYVVPGAIGTAVVLLLLPAAGYVAWRAWPRSLLPLRTGGLLALVGTLVVASAAVGYSGERHYLRGRFTTEPGLVSLSNLWQWARGVHHSRIGIVGTFGGFFAYPLVGVDGSNQVQYIAHRGPHGSFNAIATCREWRQAVNAGRYRYVVTSASRDVWSHALGFSPEGTWTGSDPGARVLFPRVTHAQPIVVYEILRPLDPARC
jgi:hypothetical protein